MSPYFIANRRIFRPVDAAADAAAGARPAGKARKCAPSEADLRQAAGANRGHDVRS